MGNYKTHPRNRIGRISRRDEIKASNAAVSFYAAAYDKDPTPLLQAVPPKRNRVFRPVDGRPSVPLESAVNDEIFSTFHKREDVRIWRNNRGVALYGNKQVTYGVGPNGASDWIGYRKVLITQAHVGKTIAQFVALEAKRQGEKPDEKQAAFIDKVNADGGRAGWADSAEKAKELLP